MAEKKAIKARAAVKVPTKRTMNFAHHESGFNPKKVIPVVVVAALLAAVLVKFGILDQTQKKMDAYAALAQKQEQLAVINGMLRDYDDLANQYGRYSYGWMKEDEIDLVNRIEVLNLVEKKVASRAVIENLAVNSNVLTLNVHGLTLDQASDMVKSIELSPLVESASVYNVEAEEAEEASIFMSINLTREEAE